MSQVLWSRLGGAFAALVLLVGCPGKETLAAIDAGTDGTVFYFVPDAGPDAGSQVPLDGGGDAGAFADGGEGDGGGNGPGDGGQGDLDGGGDAGAVDAGKPVVVDLRADNNRDGVISLTDPSEDLSEDEWNAQHGAIFLANIDDDQRTCPLASDVDAPRCHDAADLFTNGIEDLEDIARLSIAPWAEAPADAQATFSVSLGGGTADAGEVVNMFRINAAGTGSAPLQWKTASFGPTELRAGMNLGIEGRDIVRRTSFWNGFVSVTLTVTAPPGTDFPAGVNQSDTVVLRVSPMMFFHHGTAATNIYASAVQDSPSTFYAPSADFNRALDIVSRDAGLVADESLQRTGTGFPGVAFGSIRTSDQWAQDFFETGYMSMPGPGGTQKVIHTATRSANVYNPQSVSNKLRTAGDVVYSYFRGRDVAGITQVDYNFDPTGEQDSLDSFGNTETIPPFSFDGGNYPLGRILRGGIAGFQPDPSFSTMLSAQRQQPLVFVDTSWLLVGHVDETVSFLPANNARGWVMLVNDARMARQMLIDQVDAGFGNVQMFVGKEYVEEDQFGNPFLVPAATSINQVLANTEVMGESAIAAAEVDAQVAIIKAATGLTDAEIIRVPFLHEPIPNSPTDSVSLAYQPGTVNGLLLDERNFIPPNPFGPVIGGRDIMKKQLKDALGPLGYRVHWVDDWDLYHTNAGEVHCGSNAFREIPSARWWETGR